MTAFDTDVLSQLLAGNIRYAHRLASIPPANQYIPIIVVEEIVRGRLNTVRQAESGKAKLSLEYAYQLLENALKDILKFKILPYTSLAEVIFQEWRSQKIRIGTHDMRIAAICVANKATLITHNRRDYERIPDLDVEFWE